MGTALVVTSGKGGVGKTTTSANIGTALALQGKRVVLLDLDIGLRNLDVVMGLSTGLFTTLSMLPLAARSYASVDQGQTI